MPDEFTVNEHANVRQITAAARAYNLRTTISLKSKP